MSQAYFAIPPKGQVLGVVDDFILFIFTLTLADLFLLLLLAFLTGPCLLALHIFMSQLPLLLQGLGNRGSEYSTRPTEPQQNPNG